jgi:Domain of unknown function (DUF932)
MELFKANRQWSTRPADERFPSLQALYDATKAYAQQAKVKDVQFSQLRVEARDNDVELVGKANVPAKLTHWAFGQLCARVQAPASYLRELPATLACQNLNHGLAQRVKEQTGSVVAKLMFHSNGGLLLRAITSDEYARIWNYEVADRLRELETQGWEPAMSDIRKTGEDFPALYASDHDMFAFVRNRQSVIKEAGNPSGLQRGVIVENSEVGASALKLTRFLYREMCGNHIIWGASKVLEISVRHIGSARQKWGLYAAQIRQYANEGATDTENRIAAAQHKVIGATKEEVLDSLFGKRSLNLSRKALEASYDAVVPDQDGDPKTVWGMVQGITRYSQTVPFADKRTDLDEAAGKVMEFTF